MTIHPIGALVTAGAALSIVLAPVAQAAPVPAQEIGQHISPTPERCVTTNAGSKCVSPGNVEINDAPPVVFSFPYGTMPWIL